MSINVASSGVFNEIGIDGSNLTIPIASIRYAGGTISNAIATGDYRGLMRGIQESYNYFMTGVATGTANPANFNTPAFFGEKEGPYSIYQSDYLKKTYSTTLYYNIMESSTIPDES
jgi:hypothetical protein